MEHSRTSRFPGHRTYYFWPLTHTFVGLLTRCSEIFSRFTNFMKFIYLYILSLNDVFFSFLTRILNFVVITTA